MKTSPLPQYRFISAVDSFIDNFGLIRQKYTGETENGLFPTLKYL